jgi:hypothetical protein
LQFILLPEQQAPNARINRAGRIAEQPSILRMKDKLIPLRLNELLDFAAPGKSSTSANAEATKERASSSFILQRNKPEALMIIYLAKARHE